MNFVDTVLEYASIASNQDIEAVRCVGNHNADRVPAFPRMHNKFLVFCGWDDRQDGCGLVRPEGVWTGSFNLTKNATASFENALHITRPGIVRAYFMEYAQIALLSEPLDWYSEWVAPEWRIGT